MLLEFFLISEKTEEQEEEDEDLGLNLNAKPEKQTVTPKWSTRVFAMQCIRMIIESCKQNPSHFDLALAREMEQKNNKSKISFQVKFMFFVLLY